jgi:hypothetical protein
MYDVLAKGTDKVVLAHPKRVKAIAVARIKTDKIDANILAHLARADLLPTAYAPPFEIRELRDLVRHRSRTWHRSLLYSSLCWWECGANEYISGLVRKYIPINRVLISAIGDELEQIMIKLSYRTRKCLDFKSPIEVFFEQFIALMI